MARSMQWTPQHSARLLTVLYLIGVVILPTAGHAAGTAAGVSVSDAPVTTGAARPQDRESSAAVIGEQYRGSSSAVSPFRGGPKAAPKAWEDRVVSHQARIEEIINENRSRQKKKQQRGPSTTAPILIASEPGATPQLSDPIRTGGSHSSSTLSSFSGTTGSKPMTREQRIQAHHARIALIVGENRKKQEQKSLRVDTSVTIQLGTMPMWQFCEHLTTRSGQRYFAFGKARYQPISVNWEKGSAYELLDEIKRLQPDWLIYTSKAQSITEIWDLPSFRLDLAARASLSADRDSMGTESLHPQLQASETSSGAAGMCPPGRP